MFLILLAAIGGSLISCTLLLPYGLLTALMCAPLTGSLCATAAAAGLLFARRNAAWPTVDTGMIHPDDQTDAMVKMLRDIAAQGRASEETTSRSGKDTRAA